MALNDIDMLSQTARGAQYPGIANPTVANDFMGTNPNETNFVSRLSIYVQNTFRLRAAR